MTHSRLRLVGCVFLLWFLLGQGCPGFSLPMGESEVANFEREALKISREIFKVPGEEKGADLLIHLKKQAIAGFHVEEATLEFEGIPSDLKERLKTGEFDFEAFRKIRRITVEVFLDGKSIQAFIDRELARQNPGKLIFQGVVTAFDSGKARVKGFIDFKKVPGNPFAFFPQSLAPFFAVVSVNCRGTLLELDLMDGQMNQQPFTSEFRQQILTWLNPLWDFSKLPYPAGFDELKFSPKGIYLRGHLLGD